MSGTAAYLNDEIETDEYVRMTFSYNMKTTQVTAVSDENTIHTAACTADATHVITEVKYGFNAFMTFEVEKFEDEKDHNIGKVQINESKPQRTSPKGFSASKCDVGNWILSNCLRNC